MLYQAPKYCDTALSSVFLRCWCIDDAGNAWRAHVDAEDEVLQLELASMVLFELEMPDAEKEHNRAGRQGVSPRSNLAVRLAA